MIVLAILVNFGVSVGLMMLQGAMTPLQHGFSYGLGPRDERKDRNVLAGRLDRTVQNQIEATTFFLPVAILGLIFGAHGPLISWGAGLFAGSRVIFAAMYIFGVPVLRSVSFGTGLLGIFLVLIGTWPKLPLPF